MPPRKTLTRVDPDSSKSPERALIDKVKARRAAVGSDGESKPSAAVPHMTSLATRDEGASRVKSALSSAKRDFAGFIEGESPHLTEDQFAFLSWRLGLASDEEAADALGAELELGEPYSLEVIEAWHANPGFEGVYQTAIGNKREGFRLLAGHLLPKGLRVINSLLDSPSDKAREKGLTLLLRAQGLLIDKVTTASPDDISRLFASLREPRPVAVHPGLPTTTVVEGEFTERELARD
jgi:hypothetical protein